MLVGVLLLALRSNLVVELADALAGDFVGVLEGVRRRPGDLAATSRREAMASNEVVEPPVFGVVGRRESKTGV
jgi:hypothetical protein